MAAKEPADAESYYRALFEEQRRRGLKLSALAAREGLQRSTLYWWRSEQRRRERARRRGRSSDRGAPGQASMFVPLRLSSAVVAAGGTAESFEILLAGGHTVRVPARFDDEVLSRLLEILQRSC